MNEIVAYFLQSGINLAILFGIYWLFLRRDTFYQANRYYLLASLVVSLIFPLIKIPVDVGSRAEYLHMLQPVVITPRQVAGQIQGNGSMGNLLLLIYLIGSGYFIVRLFLQLLQIIHLINRYGITHYRGLKLVIMEDNYVPFSMFNLVFVQRRQLKNQGIDKIIEHEKAHIIQHHTIDLLLLEIFVVFQWFNPFIWLTRKSLKNIHEYLADRRVLTQGYNAGEYQQLLLNETFGVQFIALSNNFNQSLTKKRFIMMTKKRSSGMGLIKRILIIPAALALTFAFAVNYTGNVRANNQIQKATTTTAADEILLGASVAPQEEPVYTVVEEMPKFPGGQEALLKYMVANVKYPENARKNGVQGTVFISFVVKKDGQVSNAKVLRGVDEELDKEALRVVSEMPKWNPGKEKGKPVKVQFNLPVAFKLDSGAEKTPEKTQIPPRRHEIKKIDK